MKKTTEYTAHGLALVRLLDGRRATLEIVQLKGETKEEIIRQANEDLHSLNGGYKGVRFLMIHGAILSITKTITVLLDGDETEYTNETYQIDSIGDFTAQESDSLERTLLGITSK